LKVSKKNLTLKIKFRQGTDVVHIPFIINIYHRLLLHLIFYFKIHKITVKYRIREKRHWLVL